MKKISKDFYFCFDEKEAITESIRLSKTETGSWYIIYTFSAREGRHGYYLEKDVPLIREFETLIGIYENGVDVS